MVVDEYTTAVRRHSGMAALCGGTYTPGMLVEFVLQHLAPMYELAGVVAGWALIGIFAANAGRALDLAMAAR